MGNRFTGRGAVWLARLNGVQEVVGSNPAGPTIFRNKPFGDNVEGLSHFGVEEKMRLGRTAVAADHGTYGLKL